MTLVMLITVSIIFSANSPAKFNGKPGIKAGQECINTKDHATMVWVPAGEFIMGEKEADYNKGHADNPQHKVYLDGFWIYKTVVTVAQYKSYCKKTGKKMPKKSYYERKDQTQIGNVTWLEAQAYSKWAGEDLPTEAQWEKAARGTDGRTYPWGNNWDEKKVRPGIKDSIFVTVDSFPTGKSPYGCLRMVGAEWQFCTDWYDRNYYNISPYRNPTGAFNGTKRVIRGGGWPAPSYNLRCKCASRLRIPPDMPNESVGFRCVVNIVKVKKIYK